MIRTRLLADPDGVFLHNAVLAACERFPGNTALVDTSVDPPMRISYSRYAELVHSLARGFVAAGLRPGEFVGIFLPNSWEYAVTLHAVTLAGAAPTMLNPSYREREVRFQLENSGARVLVTDGPLIRGMNLGGLSELKSVYTTRSSASMGDTSFNDLLAPTSVALPAPDMPSDQTIAALPYSSGTTGLPKGVMLSHRNLVANVYQTYAPEALPWDSDQRMLCYLPLYHIYGLNVLLNPCLVLGMTAVLMPRFHLDVALRLLVEERITTAPSVPPIVNQYRLAAEEGRFPRDNHLRWIKSGAAPLAPELGRRFMELTGVKLIQGYGMTEASPVTHLGRVEKDVYCPIDSIGQPVAKTECRIVSFEGDNEREALNGEPGELVIRGPQFMLGYWKAPESTTDVLRDGWYWSGDVATRDDDDWYRIVDRRKELIKYKGFPVAPAEIEALLLEHPAIKDCGVVGRPDKIAGEVPCAFVVLRDGVPDSVHTREDILGFVRERAAAYKSPREIRFVSTIPRTPSGKILRRDLRAEI